MPGGGVPEGGRGDEGADGLSNASLGTRFERTLVGGLRGGCEAKSDGCALAGRAGGGPSGDGGGMAPS